MPSDLIKAFPFLFYLQIISETHRRAKREKERERERERERKGLTDAAERQRERERRESRESEQRPNHKRSDEIEPQPQTQRRDRAIELAVPSSQFASFSFSFSTQSSSMSSLLISFSLLIGAVVTDLVLVLNPKLIGAANLVILISSHQWSYRLNLVVVSLSLKFSITLSSSLSQFD